MNFNIKTFSFTLTIFIFLALNAVKAQEIIQPNYNDSLQKYEKRLKVLADSIVEGQNEWVRLDAVTDFIPLFKKSLKFPGSYSYPYDSLKFMYKVIAPDNTFKIYNWTLRFDDGSFRNYGAIQMNDPLKLKLIPLIDRSDSISFDQVEDTILTNKGWYGTLYYDMAMTKRKGVKYYILLGWDGNNNISHKKIIEILSFNKEGMPVFGAPIIKQDKKTLCRKVFWYNASAYFSLNYVRGPEVISFDNLVPPNNKAKGKPWLYIPDGNYDYFQIKKGKLTYKQDLFQHVKMPEDQNSKLKNFNTPH